MKKLLICLSLALYRLPNMAQADDRTLFRTRTGQIPSCNPATEALTYGIPTPLPTLCDSPKTLCSNPNVLPGCTCTIDPPPPKKTPPLPTTMVKRGYSCILRDKVIAPCNPGEVLTSYDGSNFQCVVRVPPCAAGQFVTANGTAFSCTTAVPTCAANAFLTGAPTGFTCKTIASIIACPSGEYLTSDGTQLYCAAPY